MPERRYRLDDHARLFGQVLIGGSPLRLFRLTDAGRRTILELDRPTPDSRLIDALLDSDAIHPVPGPSPRYSESDVTIVVPTLGEPAHPPAGAVVVDDGSVPPVATATIRLARNAGPAAARNAGLAGVTTPLVAFVDADVSVSDGWLQPLLGHFDDERVAMVAPRVASPAGRTRLERYEATDSPLDLGDRPARVRAGSRISYVPGAALVCRVDALRASGGFDESLRFGEDVDLVWRLDAAGHRIRYEPAAVVDHAPRTSWSRWVRQRVGYGSAAAALCRRHPGAVSPLRMSGWSISVWGVGVGANPVAGLTIAFGTAFALVRKLDAIPARAAMGYALQGNLRAGGQIAVTVRRVWWPLVAVAAVRSRFARRVLVLSAIAARHPLRLADDVAYSFGVWHGMFGERTLAPIVPEITSWPGRSTRPT